MSSAQVAERRMAQAAVDHVALILEGPGSCLWRMGTDTSLQLVASLAQIARPTMTVPPTRYAGGKRASTMPHS
jgi:hypothetical protein